MLTIVGLSQCSTCQGAVKTLEEKEIDFTYRHIDKETPSARELKEWQSHAELPITKWLNMSGQKYREMGLSQKRKDMTDDEIFELISTEGMLIKRPIILNDDEVFVGKEAVQWAEAQ